MAWNFNKSLENDTCSHSGMTLSFAPTKVALDIPESCNKRLRSLASELPAVFAHSDADEFVETPTVVLRQFADNALRPSEDWAEWAAGWVCGCFAP